MKSIADFKLTIVEYTRESYIRVLFTTQMWNLDVEPYHNESPRIIITL